MLQSATASIYLMNEYTLAISAKAECTTMLTKTCDDLALYCLLFKLYITFRMSQDKDIMAEEEQDGNNPQIIFFFVIIKLILKEH